MNGWMYIQTYVYVCIHEIHRYTCIQLDIKFGIYLGSSYTFSCEHSDTHLYKNSIKWKVFCNWTLLCTLRNVCLNFIPRITILGLSVRTVTLPIWWSSESGLANNLVLLETEIDFLFAMKEIVCSLLTIEIIPFMCFLFVFVVCDKRWCKNWNI